MNITTDKIVYWSYGPFALNATIVYTWGTMLVLVLVSWLITRNLSREASISRMQNFLEVLVSKVRDQIQDVAGQNASRYLPFIGTLFVFILICNIFSVVPGYQAPTASLSTTTALAICVFVAVPLYGIAARGMLGYLKNYVQPTFLMLPFNIMGELSRTVALAVRLYGNIMSGTLIVGILLSIIPFIFPVAMQLLGLITGVIQAYIFAVLAMVYIAAATKSFDKTREPEEEPKET